MSRPLDEYAARLIGATSTAAAAVQAADRLVAYRDRIVREARAAGVSAIDIGKVIGVSRPRVYQILESPGPGDDWWEHEQFEEEMRQRWDEAIWRWQEEGEHGDPSEYFPLPQAVEDVS